MNIVMLGSGNVATHLGKAFFNAGHTILQVWSRDLSHAQVLADQVKAEAIDLQGKVNPEGDLYLISVVDDAIVSVLEQLPSVSAIVVHTSGSTDMTVLSSYSRNYGVFYPLQTFSKAVDVDLSDTPILLEASNGDVFKKLQKLAFSVSKDVQPCNSDQRIKLHIAAVFSCNFTNHLYAIAQRIVEESKLDFELIRPLILETARKVMDKLPSEVQTGPAVREDQLTMDRHRQKLIDHPNWLSIYNLLSADIIDKGNPIH
jgi:predicted short-subunit dehydrogenase-like oxidoreductase (DUF2520 family)